MELLGRYELVYPYWCHTGAFDAPLVLDRAWLSLHPYKLKTDPQWQAKKEKRAALAAWERHKARIADQPTHLRRQRMADELMRRNADCSKLAAIFGVGDLYSRIFFRDLALGAATNINLNNNYVAGTSGNASAVDYQVLASKTINNVYFFISSYGGTASLVTDLNLELRPESSAGSGLPNTGVLTESKTINPSSATGWINSSGWTSVLTAMARYLFIVGDANGGATNFATVTHRAQIFEAATNAFMGRWRQSSTTGGFASGNTNTGTTSPTMVLTFSDGSSFGQPLTTTGSNASNTQQRGLLITTTGLANTIKFFGMVSVNASAAISGLKVFSGTTAPNGTANHTSTDLYYGTNLFGAFTSGGTPFSLTAGTQWRIVQTFSSNSTGGPNPLKIGTGEDANLRAAMPGNGQWYFTQDDGASTWANDLVGALPVVALLVDGQTAAAASGGGGHIIGSF